jgi:F0F1-type ATP synthase assembly protein I
MVVAGDWFLSWEAKTNPLSNQLGGMIYFLPNGLGLIVAMVHREDRPA